MARRKTKAGRNSELSGTQQSHIPELSDPILGELPHLLLHISLRAPNEFSYSIEGKPEGEVKRRELLPQAQRLESSFEFSMFGQVADERPKEWEGFRCEVRFNSLGEVDPEEKYGAKGLPGDGWYDINQKRIFLRLYLPLPMLRDIINIWQLLPWDEDNPDREWQLRCDLVHLVERDQVRRKVVGFRVIRIYCYASPVS